MKLKKADYEKIKAKIKELVEHYGPEKVRTYKEALKEDKRVKDLDKRFRWNLLWATGLKIGHIKENNDLDLYSYINDDHIDTALKAIVKELGL